MESTWGFSQGGPCKQQATSNNLQDKLCSRSKLQTESESMAPTEPSFVMFSIKPQGSEAFSVRIVACSNLPDMDGPGNKSDPYVKVICNGTTQKTKVSEAYKNPVFEEFSSTFIFPVNALGSEVFIEVWDKDRLSKDDLMGKASIQLNPGLMSVADSGAFLCLPLQKKK